MTEPLTLEPEVRPVVPDDPGNLIAPDDPLAPLIWVNPGRMSGTPCFAQTRVPIQHLYDYLAGGDPLSEFLEDFEGVTEEQAVGVLKLAFRNLLESLPKP